MRSVKTIDAEVAGEAVRLVVSGGPSVPGRTMGEKLKWLRRHGDGLRQLLMLEPRGHAGMHGALLTEPVSPNAHAGVLSMHAAGFPIVSGEGVIAAVTLALENALLDGVNGDVRVDTPVGALLAAPHREADRVSSVALSAVPSFVHTAGLPLHIGTRTVRVDVAFGGEFYAIADSEAIGIPIDMSNGSTLIRMGRDIRDALESTLNVVHPADASLKGIHGTIFTGAPRTASDLRSATVMDGEVLRRSPGVTGTAALIAVLDAMGLVVGDAPFRHEGILGTVLEARVVSRQQTGEIETVTPQIEGSARGTGFHEFIHW
jgi:proline racemase